MPRILSTLACALLLVAGAPSAADALTLVVPDDVATIQGAVDAGAHLVLVRPGDYPEAVVSTAADDIAIRKHPDAAAGDSVRFDAFTVQGGAEYGNLIALEGVHVRGAVRLFLAHPSEPNWNDVDILACRIDSGIVQTYAKVHSVFSERIEDCVITGDVSAPGVGEMSFLRNRVLAGGFYTLNEEGSLVEDNVFVGDGSGIAIRLGSEAPHPRVARNQIHGYAYGFRGYGASLELSGNRIESCSIAGISVQTYDMWVHENVVLGCGTGIALQGNRGLAHRNVVLGCTGPGIFANELIDGEELIGNVVGRCGDAGILVNAVPNTRPSRIVSNTSFRNGGSGYRVAGTVSDPDADFERNIAYQNGRYGLEAGSGVDYPLACNDWFENVLGAVDGAAPGASDLAVDPMFCDVDADDVTLNAYSPLLNAIGCGTIGARGMGCPSVDVPARSVAGLFLAPPSPNPVRGGRTSFEVHVPRRGVVALEVVDLAGRRIASVFRRELDAGVHRIEWSSGAAPSGRYWARLDHPAGTVTRSFVVAR